VYRRPKGQNTSLTNLLAFGTVFLILSCSLPAQAWGGKVKLARKYRPGQRMVYQTSMQTRATLRSNPPGLTAFLPPTPTEFSTRQENTITVRAVHPYGAADVENRFGVFEFHSNLPDLLPEEVRDSARAAQEEVSKRLSGSSSFFVVRIQIFVDTLARDFIIESNRMWG